MIRQLALPELKRYLLSLSLNRTELPGRHETRRESKAAMNCRNPKYIKAARGRAALQKIQSGERRAALRKYEKGRASKSAGYSYAYILFCWPFFMDE